MTDVFRPLFSSLRRRGLRVCLLMVCALSFLGAERKPMLSMCWTWGVWRCRTVIILQRFRSSTEPLKRGPIRRKLLFACCSEILTRDYASAATDLNDAIRLNPFRSEFYALRAICRIHAKQYEDAVTDYGKVLSEKSR